MWKARELIGPVSAMLLLLLVACAPKPAPTPPLAPTPILTPESKAIPLLPQPVAARAPWRDWDKIVEAAKKEGKVNVYSSTIIAGARIETMEAVKRRYGINVEVVTARGGENTAKILAEQRGKAYVADVFEGGANYILPTLKPEGFLAEPIRAATAMEPAWKYDPFSLDPEGWALGYFFYPTSGIVINTKLVKPQEEPKSWFDLLDPKWKGKIVMDSPAFPGPGGTAFRGVLHFVGGEDYWRKMSKQEPKISRVYTEEIEMIVKGDYAILLPVMEQLYFRYLAAGAPIKLLWMKEGHFQSLGKYMALIKNAPHPNAAKVFVDWFFSREGQLVYHRSMGFPASRSDVPEDFALPELRWEFAPKVYLVNQDFIMKEQKDYELAAEIFGIKR